MNYNSAEYSFWGLHSNGTMKEDPMDSLAYLVALVDREQNEITDLQKAKCVLRYLYDTEEQVVSASELRSDQKEFLPTGYYPQTPVMLTYKWSPISTLLEHGWKPVALAREAKGWACASGIWELKPVEASKPYGQCETPEQLLWHVLEKVVEKAKTRKQLLSIIAKVGWSYQYGIGTPQNLTLAEAEKADRVIWQRTPKQKGSKRVA